MKNLKRILTMLLVSMLMLPMFACGKEKSPAATTEPSEPVVDQVLAQRRETVVAFMRQMATVKWRAGQDLVYTISSDTHPEQATGNKRLQIVKGRLYQGVPYSYAGSTDTSFLEYAPEKDENGNPFITELTWQVMSGGAANGARIGNDCSTAVMLSWSQVGASIEVTNTRYMAPAKGYLRVGEYASNNTDNTNSPDTCVANGVDIMSKAYAQLQMGDAVVRRSASAGHAMLVVDVNVVEAADGSIDMNSSYITVIEQTRSYLLNGKCYYSEEDGENVYLTFGVDVKYSFLDLFGQGYLPITCKELTDPSTVETPAVHDTETEFNKGTICKGVISSNWLIENVTVTIENESGIVQQAMTYPGRGSNRSLDLSYFINGKAEAIRGSIDPETLDSGSYHCTLICRLTTGQEFVVRNFDFTV